MKKNAALAKWRAGEQTLGLWLALPNTHVAEMMASIGFDWLCVDMQHGLVDYADLVRMLPAISTGAGTPFVRVSTNNPAEIMRALDAGAMGVIVPLVNSRAEAEAAISACRYPPQGVRSFGPIRAALYAGAGYAREANDEIACVVMIETKDGLANLDEIVTTPGLGGVYIGPSDLAFALGLAPVGDTDDATHLAAVTRIRDVCKAHRVPVGIHASSRDFALKRIAAGFDFVTLNTDAGILGLAVHAELAAARAAQGKR
jgi:4-hydroxy-2-oxoheptanedioate aldolase